MPCCDTHTENPYVRLFPTNPTEVKLGSPAAFQYTIAGFSDGFINVPEEVIDFEIIPSVDPSPSSLLSNLLQDETNPYVFSYSFQSAGTYDNGTYRFIECKYDSMQYDCFKMLIVLG